MLTNRHRASTTSRNPWRGIKRHRGPKSPAPSKAISAHRRDRRHRDACSGIVAGPTRKNRPIRCSIRTGELPETATISKPTRFADQKRGPTETVSQCQKNRFPRRAEGSRGGRSLRESGASKESYPEAVRSGWRSEAGWRKQAKRLRTSSGERGLEGRPQGRVRARGEGRRTLEA